MIVLLYSCTLVYCRLYLCIVVSIYVVCVICLYDLVVVDSQCCMFVSSPSLAALLTTIVQPVVCGSGRARLASVGQPLRLKTEMRKTMSRRRFCLTIVLTLKTIHGVADYNEPKAIL